MLPPAPFPRQQARTRACHAPAHPPTWTDVSSSEPSGLFAVWFTILRPQWSGRRRSLGTCFVRWLCAGLNVAQVFRVCGSIGAVAALELVTGCLCVRTHGCHALPVYVRADVMVTLRVWAWPDDDVCNEMGTFCGLPDNRSLGHCVSLPNFITKLHEIRVTSWGLMCAHTRSIPKTISTRTKICSLVEAFAEKTGQLATE